MIGVDLTKNLKPAAFVLNVSLTDLFVTEYFFNLN